MITDQDYNQLSDRVYWLDPKHKRYTPSIKKEEYVNLEI